MSDNVIDALVVTLGLDASNFTPGAAQARKKIEEFQAAVRALAGDESKLDESQKHAFASLSNLGTQSERTRKELSAAGSAGASFWDTFKTGAMGFGAAIAAIGLEQIYRQSVTANAGISRLAPSLGMSAKAFDTWGKAIREAVGGEGDISGAFQGLNAELAGITLGKVPTGILGALSQLSRFSKTGPLSYQNADGSVKKPDEFLLGIADATKNAGQEKAHNILDPMLGADLTNLLLKGRSGVEGALNAARPNTLKPQDYKNAEEAAKAINNLSDAFSKLKDSAALGFGPRITRDLLNITSAIQVATGQITPKKFWENYAKANADYDGPEVTKQNEVDNAYGKVLDAKGTDTVRQKLRNFFYGAPAGEWTEDQIRTQLRKYIDAGYSPEKAADHVQTRMANGESYAKVSAISVGTGGSALGAVNDALLDAVKQVESHGDANAVSPAGAQGAYQFMPKTAARYGIKNPFNEAEERVGARQLLSDLFARFGTIDKALAGYNSDPDKLAENIRLHGSRWQDYLPNETAHYIQKVDLAMGRAGDAPDAGTIINQNGPITIAVNTNDPNRVAKAIPAAIVAQANSGPH